MLKRLIQVSSLTTLLALSAILPAAAQGWSEEDAAAPAGSFTSEMAIPARVADHHFAHFAHHHMWKTHRFG